jgi:hypothetical protein
MLTANILLNRGKLPKNMGQRGDFSAGTYKDLCVLGQKGGIADFRCRREVTYSVERKWSLIAPNLIVITPQV